MENKIDFGKIKTAALILIIATVFTAIGNSIQTYVKPGLEAVSIAKSLEGSFVIYGVAMVGYLVSQLPHLKKLSPVFWVGIIGVIMSAPFFPGSAYITSSAGVVQFAALGTPTLAYAGLALGKDLPILKRMSWKIVIVALCVITGTFLLATIVSQITLTLEGVI